MFNKRKETFLTATQSYATEMLRATLKEALHTDVYLMQITLNPPDVFKVIPNEVLANRPYTNAFLVMDVKAYFTSLDRPRPHGREGIYPLIPSVNATLRFTSETQVFYMWNLFDIGVAVENFEIDGRNRYRDHITFESLREVGGPYDCASEHLRMLSKELHERVPRWPEKQ